MFCPKCKSEFREGFKRCEDCQVNLVDQLVADEFDKNDFLIELTSCLPREAIGVVKSILDAERINYTIFDESTGNLYPVPDANRLMVATSDFQTAKELLTNFL